MLQVAAKREIVMALSMSWIVCSAFLFYHSEVKNYIKLPCKTVYKKAAIKDTLETGKECSRPIASYDINDYDFLPLLITLQNGYTTF